MCVLLQLVASHEQELSLLSGKLEADRQRQMLGLRDRLDQQRRRKLEQQRRQQEADLTRESLTQRKEIQELSAKQVRVLYYMDTASLEGEMGSSRHKSPHQARAFKWCWD